MSARSLSSLGVLSIKEMDSVLASTTDKVFTSEVRSIATMNVGGQQDVKVRSASGDVVLKAPRGFVRAKQDIDVSGCIGDSTDESLRFSAKTVALNSTGSATDADASGSGIYVCGSDFADYVSSAGTSGDRDSISVLWKNDGGGLWSLKGGNLSFSKIIASGDACTFTFNITESGDMALQRTIGAGLTHSLAYWQTLA